MLIVTDKEFIKIFRGYNVFTEDDWGLLVFFKVIVMFGTIGLYISDKNEAEAIFTFM